MITDQCPYSCSWCGVYRTKLLEKGEITQKEFDEINAGSNEGDFVRNHKKYKKEYLSPDDYRYLSAVLGYYFGTSDTTVTGGDPFERKEVKEIINNINSLGLSVTGLTKGAPLFKKNKESVISQKAGEVTRLIFSIDSLNPEEHANLNLPLSNKLKALTFLPKTIEALEEAQKLGYKVEINNVIPQPKFNDTEELKNLFKKTKELIEFALDKKIVKLKFIELDTEEVYGNPYIEKYFEKMIELGYFKDYNIKNPSYIDLEGNRKSDIGVVEKNGNKVKISICRCSCSATASHPKKSKLCKFSEGSDLFLNSSGEAIVCYKNLKEKQNYVSLKKFIEKRDTEGLIRALVEINERMKKMKCPIFIKK